MRLQADQIANSEQVGVDSNLFIDQSDSSSVDFTHFRLHYRPFREGLKRFTTDNFSWLGQKE
jgi:hypothetical protein